MEKKRVLIADDEEDFVRMVKASLERREKYEVKALTSAKDILSEVKVFKPDIILLDLLMPSVGGIEACQMLNEEPSVRGIPIIILSGLDKNVDMVKAYEVGVVDYIVKPIEIGELFAKVEKVLGYKTV